MFQTISLFARRVVAYPLVVIGVLLTEVAGLFIRSSAWLIDAEDEP